jgi:hypothetical protein
MSHTPNKRVGSRGRDVGFDDAHQVNGGVATRRHINPHTSCGGVELQLVVVVVVVCGGKCVRVLTSPASGPRSVYDPRYNHSNMAAVPVHDVPLYRVASTLILPPRYPYPTRSNTTKVGVVR